MNHFEYGVFMVEKNCKNALGITHSICNYGVIMSAFFCRVDFQNHAVNRGNHKFFNENDIVTQRIPPPGQLFYKRKITRNALQCYVKNTRLFLCINPKNVVQRRLTAFRADKEKRALFGAFFINTILFSDQYAFLITRFCSLIDTRSS